MPDPIKPIARVEEWTKVGTVAVIEGAEATIFRIQAKMYVPAQKYSDGIFKVKVIKPEGIAYLMSEEGTHMEYGRFSFDSLKELAQGGELEVEVTEIEEPKDQKPPISREQAAAAAIRLWNTRPVSELEAGLEGARRLPVSDQAAKDFLDGMASYIEARKKAGALDKAEDGYFLDVLEEGFRKD